MTLLNLTNLSTKTLNTEVVMDQRTTTTLSFPFLHNQGETIAHVAKLHQHLCVLCPSRRWTSV